ncbi:hypothetical protein C8Q74DRAFT_1212442 [Fomes fomentarius]|nr:hypothetical protein C8Q74DRAFT_1212442 [Fomes fomentarius]
MQGYVTSSVVGGRDGYIFNDVYAMNYNGDFVIDDYGKSVLDKQHPIQSIYISSGWVVDGIAVKYQLKNGENTTLHHGSQFADRKEVKLQHNEILVGVFGSAGRQGCFGQREFVSKIGFVICDLNTGDIRIAGPYGPPKDAKNFWDHGEAFYVSDVLAFGGFAEHTSNLGLSGLFFFKDLSRPMKIGRYHTLPINAAVVAAEKNVEEENAVVEEVTLVEDGNGDLKDVVKGVEGLTVDA